MGFCAVRFACLFGKYLLCFHFADTLVDTFYSLEFIYRFDVQNHFRVRDIEHVRAPSVTNS